MPARHRAATRRRGGSPACPAPTRRRRRETRATRCRPVRRQRCGRPRRRAGWNGGSSRPRRHARRRVRTIVNHQDADTNALLRARGPDGRFDTARAIARRDHHGDLGAAHVQAFTDWRTWRPPRLATRTKPPGIRSGSRHAASAPWRSASARRPLRKLATASMRWEAAHASRSETRTASRIHAGSSCMRRRSAAVASTSVDMFAACRRLRTSD